ncbi:MAG TPA: hypothetical protein VGO67_24505 [Verrucomicrobiae bacterium]
MKQIQIKKNSVVWELEDDEAQMINNALNEVCNGIDVEEFETRLGWSRNRLSELLSQIHASLEGPEEKK